MRRTLLAATLLALPTAARADERELPGVADPDARYSYEPSSSALGVVFAPSTGFSAGLFAGVTAVADRDAADPTVSVGGHLATPGVTDSCRYLQAEGAYLLGEDAGATGWVEACLFRAGKVGVTAPGLTVRQDVALDVRPSLSASRTLLRRSYTGGRLRIDGSVLEAMNNPDWGSALMAYRVDLDQTEQDGRRQRRWNVAIDGVRYLPPRAIVFAGTLAEPQVIVSVPADELSFMGVFIGGQREGGIDVMAGGMMLARVLGLEYRGLVLDVEAKIASGDVSAYDDAGEPMPGGADVFTPTGLIGVGGARSWFGWAVRYARDLYPTFDRGLALEDRVDATIELRRGIPRLDVAGFAAHTALYFVDHVEADWTGGATVSRTFELGDRASLVLAAEVARSWYATLAADERPRPEVAARVWATVAASFGGYPSRR